MWLPKSFTLDTRLSLGSADVDADVGAGRRMPWVWTVDLRSISIEEATEIFLLESGALGGTGYLPENRRFFYVKTLCIRLQLKDKSK